MENFNIIKVFFLTTLSFVVAIGWTPLLTHFLFKYKLGKQIRDEKSAPIFSKLHQKKSGTPTMGGLIIWVTVAALAVVFWALAKFAGGIFYNLNFFNRPFKF